MNNKVQMKENHQLIPIIDWSFRKEVREGRTGREGERSSVRRVLQETGEKGQIVG